MVSKRPGSAMASLIFVGADEEDVPAQRRRPVGRGGNQRGPMHRQQELRIVMAAGDIVDGDPEMQAADILRALEVEGRGGSRGRDQAAARTRVMTRRRRGSAESASAMRAEDSMAVGSPLGSGTLSPVMVGEGRPSTS